MAIFQSQNEKYKLLIDNTAYISIMQIANYKLKKQCTDSDGLFHSYDGPAIEWDDGSVEWWLNGNQYSFNKWCKLTNKSKEEIVELILIYG